MLHYEELERQVDYLSEHDLERHAEKHIFKVFQDDYRSLEDRFPAGLEMN